MKAPSTSAAHDAAKRILNGNSATNGTYSEDIQLLASYVLSQKR